MPTGFTIRLLGTAGWICRFFHPEARVHGADLPTRRPDTERYRPGSDVECRLIGRFDRRRRWLHWGFVGSEEHDFPLGNALDEQSRDTAGQSVGAAFADADHLRIVAGSKADRFGIHNLGRLRPTLRVAEVASQGKVDAFCGEPDLQQERLSTAT